MNIDEINSEKENVELATIVGRLSADFMQRQEKGNRRLLSLFFAFMIGFFVVCGCLVYQTIHMQEIVTEAITQSQEAMNKAVLEALNTVAQMDVSSDTTTTTTQTVEGDSAVINNVEGEQYNDSSQKNGGAE